VGNDLMWRMLHFRGERLWAQTQFMR
jgi:hypothetical protein